MKIDSEKTIINATAEEVFNYLSNAENIGNLLPKDGVKDFKGEQTQCSFKVQGGITISLIQTELVANDQIKMKSGEKSPFPFELTIHLQQREGSTEGYIAFDGEVNAFLSMMVKTPLTNLFNYMSHKLKAVFEPEA
ncbi:MAG TPA: hypothetical protein VL021_00600 [Brumimicrobium sp.]|nr:hypothetical protein [Brumimicrobium sp.]